jgi:hypothetical protein
MLRIYLAEIIRPELDLDNASEKESCYSQSQQPEYLADL